LYLVKKPQKFRSIVTVQCLSFFGNEISADEFRDKEDPFTGNLKLLYDHAFSFLLRKLKRIQK
jgi:hypothetical protein